MAREIRIKVPSIQTIILTVLLLGALTLIVWISIAAHMEEPQPPSVAASPPAEGPAAWISALGQALGAIGTAGALWLGAVTFRRQVRDQHRAQARAVTVGTELVARPLQEPSLRCFITNNSAWPIYRVGVHGSLHGGPDESAEADVLAPGKSIGFYKPVTEDREVVGDFLDSAGTHWLRTEIGTLLELPDSGSSKK